MVQAIRSDYTNIPTASNRYIKSRAMYGASLVLSEMEKGAHIVRNTLGLFVVLPGASLSRPDVVPRASVSEPRLLWTLDASRLCAYMLARAHVCVRVCAYDRFHIQTLCVFLLVCFSE